MNITETSATGALIRRRRRCPRFAAPAANAAVFPNNPVNVTVLLPHRNTHPGMPEHPSYNVRSRLRQVRGAVPGQSQPLLQHDRPHHRRRYRVGPWQTLGPGQRDGSYFMQLGTRYPQRSGVRATGIRGGCNTGTLIGWSGNLHLRPAPTPTTASGNGHRGNGHRLESGGR